MLETLQVIFLAPAATAGAISLEREKQTLDMLIATPITSMAIVLGKLLSALTYVFLLIVASVPLTAVVFVYGGVSPEDVLKGYAVLLATALGLGAFGLFCSSLVKRTQAATAISIFGVLAVSIGSMFVLIFWTGMASTDEGRGFGPIKGRAPEIVAYVNPFIAQADVLCGTELSFGTWCSITQQLVPNQNGVVVVDKGFSGAVPVVGFANGGVVLDDRRERGGRPVGQPCQRRRSVRRPPRHGLAEERRDLADPLGHLPLPLDPARLTDTPLATAPAAPDTRGGRRVRIRRPSPRGRSQAAEAAYVPVDPRGVIDGPLDPVLLAVRSGLASHRRRLWIRRIVRRSWLALAAVLVAELVLWTVARFVPIEWAPIVGGRHPGRRGAGLAHRGRPSPTLAG